MKLFDEDSPFIYGVDGITLDSNRIRTLNDLVIKYVGTQFSVVKKERLRSKKNAVFDLILSPHETKKDIRIIAKAFVTGNYEMELDILSKCLEGGINVPRVIGASDGVILMTYIYGEPFVDRINRTFELKHIEELARWYYDFHTLQPLLKGDPRLRNFVINEDGLFGIDFEEAMSGHWIIDIGGIAASLLDTDPINDTRKRKMVWILFDKYLELKGIQRTNEIDQDFIEVISNTLKQTARWRNSEEISNLADLIQKEGIPI